MKGRNYIMNVIIDEIQEKEEEIRKKEPYLLLEFVAEIGSRASLRTPADTIAIAICNITQIYATLIRKYRGGWICGTHTRSVRNALSHTISSKYSDEDLLHFINFCLRCTEGQGQKLLQSGDNEIADLVYDLLHMRPEPFVHPPASWWRRKPGEETNVWDWR